MFAIIVPTGSDHDRSRLPVATLSLIAVNLIVFVLSNLGDYEKIIHTFGFIAANPLPHQFLTHMFLHAGWPTGAEAGWPDYLMCLLHIGGNMAYLWFAGGDLEDVMGSAKFLAAYFLSGIAAAMLFWVTAVAGRFTDLGEPAVGASGAISGLLGLYLIRFPRFKIRLWFGAFIPFPFIMRQGITRISSIFFIGAFMGIELFLGIQTLKAGGGSGVAHWAHIGGFLLGVLYGLMTKQFQFGQQEYLLKEADYLFYKQKWHSAMEYYQKAAQQFPRCVEAFSKWALCWECSGIPKRGERVLYDALHYYTQQGWEEEAAVIREELDGMTGKPQPAAPPEQAAAAAQPATPAPAPNLLFRKDVKWKGKPR
jgi:hypothetical protein